MPVTFNVVERRNPANQDAPKKFYPSILSSGRMSLRQLATRITQMSTVSTADTMAVLECMLSVIPQELAEGKIVELGDFGNFWLRSEAEGVDDEKKVNASLVTNVKPRFNPGKEFKKALNSVKFVKMSQN